MVRKKSPRQKNTSLFVQHCIAGERGAGFYFAPTGLTKNGFLVFYSTFDFSGLAPRTHHGFRFPFFLGPRGGWRGCCRPIPSPSPFCHLRLCACMYVFLCKCVYVYNTVAQHHTRRHETHTIYAFILIRAISPQAVQRHRVYMTRCILLHFGDKTSKQTVAWVGGRGDRILTVFIVIIRSVIFYSARRMAWVGGRCEQAE